MDDSTVRWHCTDLGSLVSRYTVVGRETLGQRNLTLPLEPVQLEVVRGAVKIANGSMIQ